MDILVCAMCVDVLMSVQCVCGCVGVGVEWMAHVFI